jgi:hypothetical protein
MGIEKGTAFNAADSATQTSWVRQKLADIRQCLFLFFLLALLAFGANPASAQAVDGWNNSFAFGYSSADAACEADYAHLAALTLPVGAYLGTEPYAGPNTSWKSVQCKWTGPEGRTLAGFFCVGSGEVAVNVGYGLGRCVHEDASTGPAREPNNNNKGANINPTSCKPINFLSGAKLFEIEDFRSGNESLFLARRYNSRPYGIQNSTQAMLRVPQSLGSNWQFDFFHEIQINSFYPFNRNVGLETSGGSSFQFIRQTDGSMLASSDLPQTDYTMEFVGTYPGDSNVLTVSTQWKVKDPQDRIWLFQTYNYGSAGFAIGHPISVTFRGGLQWTFSYGTNNELTAITDSFGQQITFTWIYADPNTVGLSGSPRPLAISKATLPDGSSLAYSYEAIGTPVGTYPPRPDRLVKVEQKDSSNNVLDSTTYAYRNSSLPTAITAVYDNTLSPIVSVTYDALGHATQSTGPSGIDSTTVAYPAYISNSTTTVTRTVTNALGKDTVYAFSRSSIDSVHDDKLTSITGTASTHCVASNGTLSYTNSMVSSTTDEEGRVTNYTRDTKGHPTLIVDGFGTASARTRSFTWHATFDVPTQIVEPGLTTDLTWNASGQLTQLMQTDTTSTSTPYSTNGQTRVWSFGYGTRCPAPATRCPTPIRRPDSCRRSQMRSDRSRHSPRGMAAASRPR